MRILSLSDTVVSLIYSPLIRSRHQGVDVVLGCGDLPYHYLEYVISSLDAPLFYVRGNHDKVIEYGSAGQRSGPHGGYDLHGRTARYRGLLLAGVEGSLRYRPGPFQYTQNEMWWHVLRLTPGLLRNRLLYGRYLDVFITHAPSAGVNDANDLPHRGINAFRWLVNVFQPALHIHGHIHVYYPWQNQEIRQGATRVINTYSWRETLLELPDGAR
jgi:Icc-related predicted phosphoesterase